MISVTDKHNCCGCNACGDICPKQAISFKDDNEGFWYPEVDMQKCIDCGLCEKICPFLNAKEQHQPLEVYAAINPDEEIRRNSSSGGMFQMLSKQIIEKGGLVFGAAFDKDWMVHHLSADNYNDVKKFQGSKYVQSCVSGCYVQVQKALKEGRKVLFSGTSCQIAALKGFLRKEYDNLLTVDVVCHGVPSPGIWRKYLETLQQPCVIKGFGKTDVSPLNTNVSIESISFRDKQEGWRNFCFTVHYSVNQQEMSGTVLSPQNDFELRESLHDNVFMQGFLHNLYLRPSCYTCKVKSGRCHSDLTLADFWGIWNEIPQIYDDKGISLVLVNTEKGKAVIDTLDCFLMPVKYEQGVKYNPCIEHSVEEKKWRSVFMHRYNRGDGLTAVSSVIKLMQPTIFNKIISKLKNKLYNK